MYSNVNLNLIALSVIANYYIFVYGSQKMGGVDSYIKEIFLSLFVLILVPVIMGLVYIRTVYISYFEAF